MKLWEDPKNPSEVKRYAFDWTADLGSDTIESASASLVSGYGGGLTISESDAFDGVYSYVTLSGGTAGETAMVEGTIVTVGGETFTETGVLKVIQSYETPAVTAIDLNADLVALKAARLQFLTTGQVKEVSRDGRRIVRNFPSLADLDAAIKATEAAIKDLTATTDSTPRRFRALRPRFS